MQKYETFKNDFHPPLNSFIGPFSLSSFRFTNYIEMEKALQITISLFLSFAFAKMERNKCLATAIKIL